MYLLNLCKISHYIVLCCRNRLMMQSSRHCHQRIRKICPHCHRQYSSPQEGEVGYLPNRCPRRMPPAMWKRYLNFVCSTEAKENMLQHPSDWTSEVWTFCKCVEKKGSAPIQGTRLSTHLHFIQWRLIYCGSSALNLYLVTSLVSRILKWLVELRKICRLLV